MARIQTFSNLREEVLGYLDEGGATGTTLTIVNNALNSAYVQRLTEVDWNFMLWPRAETLTTVVGQRTYGLHSEYWKGLWFRNRTTKSYLIETPMRQLEQTGADWNNDTGSAERFTLTSRTQIQNQPSSASVISIVSSSASDASSAKAITVGGMTSTGYTTESITPNGITAAPGSTSFTEIITVTKAAAWVGTMTMTSNSGAVTNLTLFPTEYGRSHQQIELLRAPATAETIEYRFYRQPPKLTNDNDVPLLPPPTQEILVYDALIHIAGYNTDMNAQALGVWRDNQQRLERLLQEAQLEGQMIAAEPRSVRYLDGPNDFPVFYTS